MENRLRGRGVYGNIPRGRGGGYRGGLPDRGWGAQGAQHREDGTQNWRDRPDNNEDGRQTWRDRPNNNDRNNDNNHHRQNDRPRCNYRPNSNDRNNDNNHQENDRPRGNYRPNNNDRNNDNNHQHQNDRPRGNYSNRTRPERTMGFPYVQKLLNNEDLQEVILGLSNDRNGFSRLLDNKEISNDLIILLVRLVRKVCGSTFQEVKITILIAVLESRFMEKLTLYITELISQTSSNKSENKFFWDDPDDFWYNLINISKTVQEIIPTNCAVIRKLLKTMTAFFPHIEETDSKHISDEIKAQALSLLEIVEKTVESLEVKRRRGDVALQEDMEPPDDFRQIAIIPSVQEIVAEKSLFLRPNIVDRAFSSIDQYLDIQFRLLREDFIAPLRRGINTFLRNQSKPRSDWKKLEDIKVYSPVRFLSIETVNECHCYEMRFYFGKEKRSFSYENSKRFMFGSLVCFTCDNFKTLLFGKIVKRDQDLLEEGLLVVGFQEQVNINYEIDYLMVESSVYFEPYYQVLGVLKRMDADTFPMEKYIIRVETESNPPKYLVPSESVEPVFYQIEETNFCPLNIEADQKFYSLNDSQLSAFKSALSEEFCIIQGPPGTGKTFLGLKIAHTLLNNRGAWYNRTPILVICYTNHALDQFLNGILPVTDNILRVGGQSKDEKLKEYNLTSKRRNTNSDAAVHQKRHEVEDYMELIKAIGDTLNEIDRNESILSLNDFREVIDHNTWFAGAREDDFKRWLLEAKWRDREVVRDRPKQQAEDRMQNMPLADQGERVEDLGVEFEGRNGDGLDDEFNNTEVFFTRRTFISLPHLRKELDSLNKELDLLATSPDQDNWYNILRGENIQLKIWNTETDLDYISDQLAFFEDRRKRHKPRRINLVKPFKMLPRDRWQLYFYWVEKYAVVLRRKYEQSCIRFREVFRVYSEMRDIEDTQIMKEHLVVGMTTTGAARLQSSLQALKSPIVIVEEAAEVLEAHIVAALTSHCQHLILIGDHLQLKPGAADYQIETKYKLGVSLFERMVRNKIRCHTLDVQHRMRPEISRLVKPHIYPNLEDDESTLQRPPILGMEKCIYFIDHQEQEDVCQDASKKSIHECQFLIALARHLILNGYQPDQITILAAYLGQFFEMVREKKKPRNIDFLQDVRIAVLDNYQGEESDIILLSLVRSNAENKAGFLRIQNRVCVALSRARDGFYIMGNMSLLLRCESENQIWENVKAVLDDQQAIGPHLTLRCQIHPHRFTQVSKAQDFVKLSEGGCDLMCDAQVACGHICKRLCHVQDRDHRQYKCNEKCTRLLCNDPTHICRKLCYEWCGLCTYLVPRDLDCGHSAEIRCHIDPAKYGCQELAMTKLPCGHEANKPCWADPEVFKCFHPCDTRVEPCGHACDWLCHKKDDPDHLQYKCRQACAKPRVGCKESETPHACQNFCFEECGPCLIEVKKFRSCGHVSTVPCNLDIEDVTCEKPCKEILSCGHQCKSKCSEACKPCEVMVEKTNPECQHQIKISCHKTPTRKDCKSRVCPRALPCGHKCTNPCNAPCTETCRETVDCDIQAPCGHTLTRIECGKKDTNDKELLLKYCTEPCNAELKCKHKCSGSCSECFQFRIHKRCAEKCGVKLVCNHECPIPCWEPCKPCTRPCEMRCKHRKCTKICGELCTRCKYPCARSCVHARCTRRCEEICNVPPCTEKCQKRLKCGHPCVGFCGDPCPPLCRICNGKELTEICFGTEDEEDAIFVYLNDCKHTLEHSGLENYLMSDDDAIQFKTCPKCKTNITTTERYSTIVKKAIWDVIRAKIKSYGKPEENEAQCKQLLAELGVFVGAKLQDAINTLEMRLMSSRKQRRQTTMNKTELNAVKSKIQTLTYIVKCFEVISSSAASYKDEHPTSLYIHWLLEVLLRSEDHLTDQEIDDLVLEIKRLSRIVQFDYIKLSRCFKNAVKLPSIKNLAENIQEVLFVKKRYSDFLDASVENNLTELAPNVDRTLTISDKERMEIVRAIGLGKGHWFTCPNGHLYAIKEGGAANEVARCLCSVLPSN